jgi:translation initiation factor IF-2
LAEGLVLESRKENDGDSRACTIVVQNGTLKVLHIIGLLEHEKTDYLYFNASLMTGL